MGDPFLSHLTWPQVGVGYWVGGLRRVASLQQNFKERGGAENEDPSRQAGFNILGALGELAAAKALNRFWIMGINDKKDDPDVFPDIQVRTRSEDHWDLKLTDEDPVHHRYVLVVGREPDFRIAGWIWGYEGVKVAKIEDYGNRGSPAMWVTQDKLRDAHELIAYGVEQS
jgi:hypothetical protein